MLFCYFVVDTVGIVVVYFAFSLETMPWDIVLHHILVPVYKVPVPDYAWRLDSMALGLEISFFAKWYGMTDAVAAFLKLGFFVSWMFMRIPIAFLLIPAWQIAMYDEYPLHVFLAVMFIPTSFMWPQGKWTFLIMRKMYRSQREREGTKGTETETKTNRGAVIALASRLDITNLSHRDKE